MRGPRFGRPAAKKPSAKEKRERHAASISYQEPAEVNAAELSSRVLNAIEHLGNQRFLLPPLSEHFQRWMKDLKAVLTDFETQLPEAVDQKYQENVGTIISKTEQALAQRIKAEEDRSSEVSGLERQLLASELELSKIEREYKVLARNYKRQYESSAGKLRAEIGSLDKKRLKLLRKKPSLLQRIFGRSASSLEDTSMEVLKQKRTALDRGKGLLEEQLEKSRADYSERKKRLIPEQEALRAKITDLRKGTVDDALDVRKLACEQVRLAVDEAVRRVIDAEGLQRNAGAP